MMRIAMIKILLQEDAPDSCSEQLSFFKEKLSAKV
jgi:hypothetical protein